LPSGCVTLYRSDISWNGYYTPKVASGGSITLKGNSEASRKESSSASITPGYSDSFVWGDRGYSGGISASVSPVRTGGCYTPKINGGASSTPKPSGSLSITDKFRDFLEGIVRKVEDFSSKTKKDLLRGILKNFLEALRHASSNSLKYSINFLEHALQDNPSEIIITNEKSELSKKIRENEDYKKVRKYIISVAKELLPTMKAGEERKIDKNKKEFSATFSKEHNLDLYLAINNADLYFKKESEDTISIWLKDTYNFDNATLKENSIELIDDLLKDKLAFGKWLNEFGQDLENNHIVNKYEIKIKIETVKISILQ